MLVTSKKLIKVSIFSWHQFKYDGDKVSQLVPEIGGKYDCVYELVEKNTIGKNNRYLMIEKWLNNDLI